MSRDGGAAIDALGVRTVRGAFAANPAAGRVAGDHGFDGVLADVSEAALGRRAAELDALLAELAALDPDGDSAARRADHGTAVAANRDELFHLRELRDPHTDPQWALWRGAEVSSYVSRPYAPAEERAAALLRHLEQLPEWLPAAAALLDEELAEGPRGIAAESARGHASFYRDEVRAELGELGDPAMARRLDAALEAAATAVERHAEAILGRRPRPDAEAALGGARFCAMLEAQEGIAETIPGLRRRVEAELERLTARTVEAAARLGAATPVEAFARMEADHPSAEALLDTARGMLDRLRRRWEALGVVDIPPATECTVRATPAFFSYITAAYEPPGALDSPDLPHYYFVTPVDPGWAPEKQQQWLHFLNHATLENTSVHEVYPGHFVHCVAANRQQSQVRHSFWFSAFGEGWAHYTELLAIEQGFAEEHPWLELAMLQDALLRACRFSASVGMHAEGMSLEEATRLFEERCWVPRLAAEREALRGTYDPMYLVYTYGKLEILRWREELQRQPGFSLRRFHDGMIGLGHCPLSVVRDQTLDGLARPRG